MSIAIAPSLKGELDYPETDGQPMGENTLQFEWITTIVGGLEVMFRNRADVFVAGDLYWYPVEGNNTICRAPDAMVAFGRPKGHRSSYLQWQEEGIAPQVVFELLSPGNTYAELLAKFQFFEQYGVEEYYAYSPAIGDLSGWLRRGDRLEVISEMNGWVSPRLGIRFDMSTGELRIVRPDGQRFLTYAEQAELQEAERKAKEHDQRELERERLQRERAEQERDQERQHRERLAAKLRSLGIDPDA